MRATAQESDGLLRWAIGKAIVVLIVGVVAATMIDWSGEDPAVGKQRVPAVVRPPHGRASEDAIDAESSLVVQADQQGHFWVDGRINGVSIPFMIDTGATSVALDRETAARIGIRPSAREFTGRSNTANGVARIAPVTLPAPQHRTDDGPRRAGARARRLDARHRSSRDVVSAALGRIRGARRSPLPSLVDERRLRPTSSSAARAVERLSALRGDRAAAMMIACRAAALSPACAARRRRG